MSLHFSNEELACKHCGKMEIPQEAIERLDRLRDALGFALPLSSAYRCPEHNAAVSTTGLNGPHTKAAFDIAVDGAKAFLVVQAALAEGFTGIGVQQKGAGRFVHVDALPNEPGQPRPTVWSY